MIPCISHIEPVMESERFVTLTVVPQGTPPFNIQWFNDSTSNSILVYIQNNVVDLYAGVTVTDALGNRSELSQIVRVRDQLIDQCYFPISLSSVPVNYDNASYFADKVAITYRDENGVQWKSVKGVQPSNAHFTIHSVEYFDLFLNQYPSYKTHISFSVDLVDPVSGETRRLNVENAVIALGYEN